MHIRQWSKLLMWEIGRRLGHYGDHPHPQVVDRRTPSRVDKRVAPGGCRVQTVTRRRKTLVTICDRKLRGRQGRTTSAISQDRMSIRISRTCSTAEDWRERERSIWGTQICILMFDVTCGWSAVGWCEESVWSLKSRGGRVLWTAGRCGCCRLTLRVTQDLGPWSQQKYDIQFCCL